VARGWTAAPELPPNRQPVLPLRVPPFADGFRRPFRFPFPSEDSRSTGPSTSFREEVRPTRVEAQGSLWLPPAFGALRYALLAPGHLHRGRFLPCLVRTTFHRPAERVTYALGRIRGFFFFFRSAACSRFPPCAVREPGLSGHRGLARTEKSCRLAVAGLDFTFLRQLLSSGHRALRGTPRPPRIPLVRRIALPCACSLSRLRRALTPSVGAAAWLVGYSHRLCADAAKCLPPLAGRGSPSRPLAVRPACGAANLPPRRLGRPRFPAPSPGPFTYR